MEKWFTPETISALSSQAIEYGVKIVGAIVLWVVGRWLIKRASSMAKKAMAARSFDDTLGKYAGSTLEVVLNIVLIVALLGYFGVETTSFAALLAAAGIAIGTAWSGLLANFAAGVFMVMLRPFKAGDMVEAAGVVGVVKEVGLFATTIDTPDNVKTIIGNNKIFSGTIKNFTANPFRRVDLVAQLNHSVDPHEAIEKLTVALGKIEHTMNTPDVHILEFNLAGPVLCVRPYVHNDNYWAVYFDTNKAIRDTFGAAGYPIPENHYHIRKAA